MKCPVCMEEIPERSRFCNMCGVELAEAFAAIEQEKKDGRRPIIERRLSTQYGTRLLQVYCRDITEFTDQIDLLTVSAFTRNYEPIQRTVIGALKEQKNISVRDLARSPMLDVRGPAGCWISRELPETAENPNIRRIGCVEFASLNIHANPRTAEARYLTVLQSYFHLIDILTDTGAEIHTLVLPLLGSGKQHLDMDIISIPLVSEALSLLQRNPSVQRLVFVERSYEKAQLLVKTIEGSYRLTEWAEKEQTEAEMQKSGSADEPYVFISYSTNGDAEAAELLAECLKKRGIRCWFAPSNIRSGKYAEAIVSGIQNCTHFVCLISRNSMQSEHVLNEIDLAFKRLSEGVTILPVRLDDSELRASFQYYLSRMQWIRADASRLEQDYNELIDCIAQPVKKEAEQEEA